MLSQLNRTTYCCWSLWSQCFDKHTEIFFYQFTGQISPKLVILIPGFFITKYGTDQLMYLGQKMAETQKPSDSVIQTKIELTRQTLEELLGFKTYAHQPQPFRAGGENALKNCVQRVVIEQTIFPEGWLRGYCVYLVYVYVGVWERVAGGSTYQVDQSGWPNEQSAHLPFWVIKDRVQSLQL